MDSMDHPIEHCIINSLFKKNSEPYGYRHVAYDNGRFARMHVLNYFHDIILSLSIQNVKYKVSRIIRSAQLASPAFSLVRLPILPTKRIGIRHNFVLLLSSTKNYSSIYARERSSVCLYILSTKDNR